MILFVFAYKGNCFENERGIFLSVFHGQITRFPIQIVCLVAMRIY